MSQSEKEAIMARINNSNVIPPVFSEEVLTLSLYSMNLRMRNISRRHALTNSLDAATQSYCDSAKQKDVMYARVHSAGEVKLLAEAHKNRNAPTRLMVELVVGEEERAKLEAMKSDMLERMEIAKDVLNPNDLFIVSKEKSMQEIKDSLSSKEGDKERKIVIVDLYKEGRTQNEVPDNGILMEYEDIASSYVYDAALEAIAKPEEKEPVLSDRNKKIRNWYKAKKIDTEQLRNEIICYDKVLMDA
jgi:hypothetical protein